MSARQSRQFQCRMGSTPISCTVAPSGGCRNLKHVGQDSSANERRDGFVAVPQPKITALALPDIHIELRRGATSIAVTWPVGAKAECASWLGELLR